MSIGSIAQLVYFLFRMKCLTLDIVQSHVFSGVVLPSYNLLAFIWCYNSGDPGVLFETIVQISLTDITFAFFFAFLV